ncbi:uncharacterized protein LOC123550338 [Mercenaria mercenaria]|uniref:uncharacterized protein LOC123550338 n=1 Tax=Mercenaria mercenaria TaxID=6596 RepID=UPI00234EFDBE|nr:uncharacterized protein LOC123550338 [Mercenaria mercenaria]
MARQISTSVSDFVLACSVFYVASYLFIGNNRYAATGLLIQGAAASVGVARFAMRRPESTPVFRAHKLLSWLAATAGMGLIAYQYCTNYGALTMSYVIISFSGLVTISSQFMDAKNKQLFVQASSGLALLTVLILSLLQMNIYGISAALTYILSGAIFGSEGVMLGFQRVDLLHYGLVAGNIFFLFSLS